MENKNKKKKTIIIISVVLVILLVLGAVGYGIFTVVQKSEKERKERLQAEKEIKENFEDFKENALWFGEESVEYRTWVKNDMTEDMAAYQYDAWILSLDNQNTALTNMQKVAGIYTKNCINKHYSNKTVQQMCDSFIETYEEAINTFVTDVTDFNTKIKELREKTKNEDLKEYELKFEKIDLNKDNNFSEIEMETSTDNTDEQ